jgi:hypothetical protein
LNVFFKKVVKEDEGGGQSNSSSSDSSSSIEVSVMHTFALQTMIFRISGQNYHREESYRFNIRIDADNDNKKSSTSSSTDSFICITKNPQQVWYVCDNFSNQIGQFNNFEDAFFNISMKYSSSSLIKCELGIFVKVSEKDFLLKKEEETDEEELISHQLFMMNNLDPCE